MGFILIPMSFFLLFPKEIPETAKIIEVQEYQFAQNNAIQMDKI